jgi:hypothetical protein
MKISNRRILLLALLSLSLAIVANAQRGARTKLRSLDELTSEATQVVRGTVVSARVEPHPTYNNLMTVVVKFRVEKTLKGEAGKQIQFRQFVWDVRDFKDGAIYRRGDQMLLLLGPQSEYGLRSPVGLGQGRFRITKDASGLETAVNESGNVALFNSAAARTSATQMKLSTRASQMVKENRGGPMRLEDLEAVVQGFAKNPPARSAQ